MDSAFLFSSEQDADDPVYRCNTAVTPIFPVRAAIKPHKLTQASAQYQTLTPPECLSDNDDYEFRRIRQGFIYIFVEKSIHDLKSRTDKNNGYWLIFRYKSEDGDNNSNFLSQVNDSYVLKDPNTEMFMAGQYSFRSYEWTGDGPDSPWKLKGDIMPYAFVPRSTTKIEIAYSEERWPSKFFTEAESNPDFRSKLMQKVDLTPTHTELSAPLKELDQHVVDFKPDIVQEMLQGVMGPLQEYQDSHTGIKADKVDAVAPCEDSKTNGRIIMLHDNMGNVLEINQRIDYNDKQRNQLNLEYQYPLTIGRALQKIKPTLDEANDFSKWWNDNFVVSQELWEEKLLVEEEYNVIAKNLYKLHADSCCLGKNSLSKQIQLAFANINSSENNSNFELLSYTTEILNQVYEGVGNSTLGSQYQLKTLEGKEFTAEMGSTFKDAFSAWAKIANGVVKAAQGKLDHALKAAASFDALLHINGPELGKLKFQYSNPEFMKVMQDLFGSDGETTKNLTTDQVIEFTTKGHKAGVTTNVEKGNTASKGSAGKSQTVRKAPTVDVPHVKIHGEFVPSVDFQSLAESQSQTGMRDFAGGFGLFMGAYGIFSVIDQKDQPEAQTTLGKIGQNFYANLIVNFGTFAADVYDFASAAAAGSFKNFASANLNKTLYKKSPKMLSQPKNASTKIGRASKAINGQKILKVGGKVLGVIGILFTAFMAYEAFSTDQKAKAWGNSLAALGSILMFFGPIGIGVGLVLIVIGAALEYFGKRNPVEDWAYRSFWGQSEYYWGETNIRPKSLDEQILEAKKLSDKDAPNHKEIKSFFKQEVQSYEDLFLQLQIKEIRNKGAYFTLYLPRYAENGSSPKLTLSAKVTYLKDFYSNGQRVMRHRKVKLLKQVGYQVNVTTGVAVIDIGPELEKDNIELSEIHLVHIDVDYRSPTGKEYPWDDKKVYESQHKHTWSTYRE